VVAERRDDGSVVVSLQVRNRPALRNFALTMLDHAEILEPSDLRDDMRSWLEGFLVAGDARPGVDGAGGER
jgi:predicted DNA-binding transcriptional regulator YafY